MKLADLPTEILLKIFKNLNQYDVTENCLKTCIKWREIISKFFIEPYLNNIAKNDSYLKKQLEEGWTNDCEYVDILVSLYQKKKKGTIFWILFCKIMLFHNVTHFKILLVRG